MDGRKEKKGKGKGKKEEERKGGRGEKRGRKEKGGWDIFNLHNFVDLVYSTEPTDTLLALFKVR